MLCYCIFKLVVCDFLYIKKRIGENMSKYGSPETFWNMQESAQKTQNPYFNTDMDYENLRAQELDFQTFGEVPQDEKSYSSQSFMGHKGTMESYSSPQYPQMFTPDYSNENNGTTEFDEPPLLEELEIYPDRIMEKTLAVLNPFRSHGLADDAEFLAKDTDLAGPLVFCLILAVSLFISGNKAPIGYIYGLSAISCILMYFLLTLMTPASNIFTIFNVASILGYSLLPIVVLSVVGIFISLHITIGICLAVIAVLWSSVSASRLFVAMSGDKEQRPLIAYPCALVCGVFALLVVF